METVRTRAGNFLVIVRCPNCKTEHAIEKFVYDTAEARKEKFSVTCPNGHEWHYCSGPTEAEKLRAENRRLQDRLNQKDAHLDSLDRQLGTVMRSRAAVKGQLTKVKKRVHAGVCPCCNRSFQNLREHMKNQHPDFASETEEENA